MNNATQNLQQVDGVDAAQLLRDIGEASASESAIDEYAAYVKSCSTRGILPCSFESFGEGLRLDVRTKRDRAKMPPAGTKLHVGAAATVGAVAGAPGLAEAVRNLVKAKGRFHTEQNYKGLIDALARHDARHAEPSPSTVPEVTRQDLHDVFSLAWNQALADAALYVASHCALEEHHVEHILELVPPTLRVRGVEIAFRPDDAGAAGAGAGGQRQDAQAETRMDAGSKLMATLAQAMGVRADFIADFIEWHSDTFGYCFDDEKSFTDGDLQAVAWAAWQGAHTRVSAKQASGVTA